ncbi:T9SS type A sorting domain-containing protein [Cytophaga hutchinsonii]|uniref:CHU large protein uncharacterized n=1 Tax=Cytophaga hutchinsonii (strain ATCC 33406 / DSM 1761 / CIP 103989 / NBRC 15051 / NCIMB 9469 / D465) TaxID=269798 RepID=A0A6N4SP20_CYTH3|nr:T9SS type A sorting domain-containing protein [Cytophaga hutchinsonii]ABG58055.1 CHU large protein; uncharacterized [Cytophaga hutchinsonii ATCC 33406]SFX12453.1 Por secretion system C-terminal sorting domain-containing protein [Cytophaga hutchinsonii ATCC 33406]
MLAILLKRIFTIALLFLYAFGFFTGNAQNYPAVFNPNTLNGANGFSIKGVNAKDYLGNEVSIIGDINNDGLDDICVSTQYGNPSLELAGVAYIIFGSSIPFPAAFDLNTLNGGNGFKVIGIAEDERRGKTIGRLGDINGDGIDDVSLSSEGSKHMFLYGKTGAFPSIITINDINGSNGFIFNGSGIGEVKGAGDVNGDGVQDIIMGQYAWSGETYILFGKKSNFPASIDAAWLDGTRGFRLGEIDGNISAFFVSPAGDVNADGYDDVIVGIWFDSYVTSQKTYVFFGKPGPYTALINLKAVNGTDGFAINNQNNGNFLASVAALGDINGDEIDDCFSFRSVIFGSKSAFPAVIDNEIALNPAVGFVSNSFLQTAAGIGDINQDGVNDFIVSAYNNENWVVYGSKTGFGATLDPAGLNGTKGFKFLNMNQSNTGRQMSGGGDINGDGIPDFIVGNSGINNGTFGIVYIVFGGDHYALPLTTDYPKALNITSSGFTLQVNTKEKGKIKYAVYGGAASAVTQQSVIASGTGSIQHGEFAAAATSININNVLTGLASGTAYDVYLYFEDEKGNTGEIYKLDNVTTLTVAADTEAPVITGCPANKKQGCGALLNFTSAVTVTDNIDATPAVTQSPAPGSPVKTNTTVTITARDKNNNTSTCVFLIEVVNSIQCPGNQQLPVGMVLPDYAKDAAVTGFCEGIPTITQTPAPGTRAANNMTVTLTSTDGIITSTCSFVVNNTTTPIEVQAETDVHLILYPNPARDILYVKGCAYNKYEMIDQVGTVVLQGADDAEINVSSVSNGMYMMLFYNKEGTIITTKKVIKN